MQESRHRFQDEHGNVRELMERYVANESETLHDKLHEERMRAYTQHETLKEVDPEATVEIRETRNIGRNDLCPCGSDLKFKKCCGSRLAKDDARVSDVGK